MTSHGPNIITTGPALSSSSLVCSRWPLVTSFSWARHWPLAFLGLAVFLFFRADPENWPLGPRSFWQSFMVGEVLRHRLFVLLISAFAVFEWGVATGRISSQRGALVFPRCVCRRGRHYANTCTSAGKLERGAVVGVESHSAGDFCCRRRVVAMAGSSYSGTPRRFLTWVWPACFLMIGTILLNYRES